MKRKIFISKTACMDELGTVVYFDDIEDMKRDQVEFAFRYAFDVADELDEDPQDVCDWLYHGEGPSGDETVDSLVQQYRDEVLTQTG